MKMFSTSAASTRKDAEEQPQPPQPSEQNTPASSSITVERNPLSKELRSAIRKNINIGKSSGERKKAVG